LGCGRISSEPRDGAKGGGTGAGKYDTVVVTVAVMIIELPSLEIKEGVDMRWDEGGLVAVMKVVR
jgi:hypothetical protein